MKRLLTALVLLLACPLAAFAHDMGHMAPVHTVFHAAPGLGLAHAVVEHDPAHKQPTRDLGIHESSGPKSNPFRAEQVVYSRAIDGVDWAMFDLRGSVLYGSSTIRI